MSDSRFAVRRYIGEGWSVIPIPKGSKAPTEKDWVNRTFLETDFAEDSNIGVRLGKPSGNLVDIDLDCPEAVKIAPLLLLKTDRIHGRPGTGASHYWYVTDVECKSERWLDTDGKVLLEIRSTGGQTVLPPSTHPSGESLYWEQDRPPARVAAVGMRASAQSTVTATLLAKHWPTGSRHVCARDVAGFLCARELDPREIEEIIGAAAWCAGDDEVEDRKRVARDTCRTFAAGNKTTGGPTLEASIGKDVVALLSKWYGGNASIHNGVIEEMNKKHFGVWMGKDYVYGTEREQSVIFSTPKALYEAYASDKILIGEKEITRGPRKGETEKQFRSRFEIWREHPKRRMFRDVTFEPPPRTPNPEDYNLWRGLAIEPDVTKKPLADSFLSHILEVLCSGNQEHYEYMLNLLAFTVQFPGTPSEVAVVMKGQLGTGKGIFVRNFGAIFGRHYVQLDRGEHLTGKFNASISGKVVVFADEAFFAGDKSHLGTLKRIITEPTLQIERKGIDAAREPNNMHLFMATNEEWSVPAGFQERRFFMISVSASRMQDHAYFDAIQKDLDNGGLQGFLAILIERPVTHNDIRKVPRTDELRVQQEHTMAAELKWWKIRLEEGILQNGQWPHMVNVKQLWDDYIHWCDTMNIHRRVTDIDMARRVLAPWLIGPMVRDRVEGRQVRMRELMPLDEARQLFDAQAGTRTPWETDQEPSEEREDLPF